MMNEYKREDDSSVVSSSEETEKHEAGVDVRIGFGKMADYPVITMICAGIIGIGIGIGLFFLPPDSRNIKGTTILWLGLLGDLFIRSLKCIILPIVFVGMTLSMVEMLSVGKSAIVGKWTVVLYLTTTLLASIWGILVAVAFRDFYTVEVPSGGPSQLDVRFACHHDNDPNTPGEVQVNNASELVCGEPGTIGESFRLIDENNMFVTNGGGPVVSLSLSQTLYEGFFLKLIPENLFVELFNANFAAVMVFAIAFGAALYKTSARSGSFQFIPVLREIEQSLLMVLSWVLKITPFAVISLIIPALGNNNDLQETFLRISALLWSAALGLLIQVIVVYIGLTWLVTREMPFGYLRKLVPAQMTAFASSSSAGTLPVTLQCVTNSGYVKPVIAKFVLPLGATLNMDGSAIYICIAVIFLAENQGLGADLTAASYAVLVLLATIGSAGTAPVPSASLALIITAFNTLFPTENLSSQSSSFALIFAIDWLIDRLRTVINVTGDCCVTRMISHIVGNAFDEEASVAAADCVPEESNDKAVNWVTE